MELLVGGQNTVVGALERIAAMVFAEGGELSTEKECFEYLVAEFRRESEDGGGAWVHGWGVAAQLARLRLVAVRDVCFLGRLTVLHVQEADHIWRYICVG